MKSLRTLVKKTFKEIQKQKQNKKIMIKKNEKEKKKIRQKTQPSQREGFFLLFMCSFLL